MKQSNFIWIIPILGISILIYASVEVATDNWETTNSTDKQFIENQTPLKKLQIHQQQKPPPRQYKSIPKRKRFVSRMQPQLAKDQFIIFERKMLNDALILSVDTRTRKSKELAEYLIKQNPGYYMIRVFFYDLSDTNIAKCRYEWTQIGGLTKTWELNKGVLTTY